MDKEDSLLEKAFDAYLSGERTCICGYNGFLHVEDYTIACTRCDTEIDLLAEYEDSKN
jgi:hypothetical protein